MNIVRSDDKLMIYGDAIQTFDNIPVGSYEVNFTPFTGFFLRERTDLQITEKIYGNTINKVDKVMKSFNKIDRNFGVILSGRKGIGKSIFAKMLSKRCLEDGIPVILVNSYIKGIASFISSIEQTVCFIFDEYDKTFYDGSSDGDEDAAQNELLPLFDGMDNGKKLFVITCNDLYKLSEFIKNRPGRFHYHFTLREPGAEEIEEYLRDNLEPEFYNNIEKVLKLSMMMEFTYDYLRAVCFELNQGYELNDALSDLNITNEDNARYTVVAFDSNGIKYEGDCGISFISGNRTRRCIVQNDYTNGRYKIEFNIDECVLTNGIYEVQKFKFARMSDQRKYDDDWEWSDIDDEDDDDENIDQSARKIPIVRVYFHKSINDTMRFMV